MEIAPNFSASDWKKLNLDEDEQHWLKAIAVLRDRLHSRYLQPIDVLIAAEANIFPADRRFGFTILAIDLLLIETLQAFKEGLEDTNGKSREVFTRFLRESPNFSKYFTTDVERIKFYKEFRCGILHQAEVQSTALVWSFGELYERANGLEVLNRNALHNYIKEDLESYLNELKNPGSVELRRLFKKKMDSLSNRGAST